MSEASVGFKPLNEPLYHALKERFGSVIVANEGFGMNAVKMPHPITGRMTTVISAAGEYYRVCCPHCRDGRHRLWFNHFYGQGNQFTGRPETWLVICYNQHCIDSPGRRQQLEYMILGMRNRPARNQVLSIGSGLSSEPRQLAQVEPPGELVQLQYLPAEHPARLYLIARGYDPDYLGTAFNICYCQQASSHYRPAQSRIVIPILMGGVLVGWQCRYVGDADWKTVPKYYGRPNMPKKLMLYNVDVAEQMPFVVVVEGAPSVWKIGAPAVALLGKTLSAAQQMLLRKWSGKPVVLILDPDAREEMEGILNELVRLGTSPIVPIYLPEGMDPGDLTHEANVNMIRGHAAQAGIQLPEW